jgi:signal transduction histidine kinase
VIAAGDAQQATPIRRAVGDGFGHAEQAHVPTPDTWTRTLEGPPANLVIAAWPLGWVDGQEFFRALHDRWPGVPVIVITEIDTGFPVNPPRAGVNALLRTTPDGLGGVLAVIGALVEGVQPRGSVDAPGRSPGSVVSAESPDTGRQREMQRWQAQKIDALARLAGAVAHDFNNFLMAVMGYTEMLACRMSATEEPCQEIEDIRALCRDATTLTQQLLTFGRRQVRQMVVLDVNQLVADLDGPLRQVLGGTTALTVTPAPEAALVRADRRRLEQVFLTLAARARDVLPSGGAVTIEVDRSSPAVAREGLASVAELEAWVAVRVTDTGPGLDAEAVERIFEPSFPKTRDGRGHGPDLALANVYAIVQQCEGRISVTSAPGVPTTFTIAFPRAAPAPG